MDGAALPPNASDPLGLADELLARLAAGLRLGEADVPFAASFDLWGMTISLVGVTLSTSPWWMS